jgi:glutathione S-transferase
VLKLFHCPNSCSLAPLIALEETGAAFEKVIVDLVAGDQNTPEYLTINPKGRVPALVTQRGVLTECPALLIFIAQSFPAAGLAPLEDPFAFARMESFNAFIASTLQPSYGPIARPLRYSDDTAAQESMKIKAAENVTSHLALIERELLEGCWVLGDQYSVADCYLFAFSALIQRLNMNAANFSRILMHADRMRDRPAVQRALK